MAYALPTDPVLKYHVENLPPALLAFESGINESDSVEAIHNKMVAARDFFTKNVGSILGSENFINATKFGYFFKWQVVNRLSPAKYEAFKSYSNALVASKTSSFEKSFTPIAQTVVQVGSYAAAAGAVAGVAIGGAAVLGGASLAGSLSSVGAALPAIPGASQVGAAVTAAVVDEARKRATQEVKNILQPVKADQTTQDPQQPNESRPNAESSRPASPLAPLALLALAALAFLI
jgi:hypothetical protein